MDIQSYEGIIDIMTPTEPTESSNFGFSDFAEQITTQHYGG
jgi:hypothetical protein